MTLHFKRSGESNTVSPGEEVSRAALWFGFLGGAAAWMAHLLLVYIIGEFGCLTALRDTMFAGITGVAWLGSAATLLMFSLSAASGWTAYRGERRLGLIANENEDDVESKLFLARAGWLSGVSFSFVILVQSVPIFFYLREC